MSEPSNEPFAQIPSSEAELVELVRSVDVRAPDQLQLRVQALIDEHSPRRRPRGVRWRMPAIARPSWRLAGALAVAAVALGLLLGLPGGSSSPFSLRQASALTLGPASRPAPAEDPHRAGQLVASVDGVDFPYWEDSLGWRSSGARVDHLDGRSMTTVFYSNGRGQRVGYAIVAGRPAPRVSGGHVSWRSKTAYRITRENGAQVVTWERNGHLCVIAGRDVSAAALLRLASSDHS